MPSGRCLPHGYCSLVPAMLVTMGWLAALFQDGCDYAKVTGSVVEFLHVNNPATVNTPLPPWIEVGVTAYREPLYDAPSDTWRTVYSGACLVYPVVNAETEASATTETHGILDGTWQITRLLAFFSLVLGGGATIFLWFSTGCLFSPGTWKLVGGQVGLACLVQSLVFGWFASETCRSSDNSCQLFWGSQADIVAASLWFTAGVIICCHYPKPRSWDDDQNDGLMMTNDGRTSDIPASTTTSQVVVDGDENSNVEDSNDRKDEVDPRADGVSHNNSSQAAGQQSGENRRRRGERQEQHTPKSEGNTEKELV